MLPLCGAQVENTDVNFRYLNYEDSIGPANSKGYAAMRDFRKQTRGERTALAAKLREAREATGLSQRDVAAALGATQSMVSDLESGRRRLDMAELKAIAALYDREMAWFIV